MKDGQPKEMLLSDYQAPGYTTTHTDLHFDIHDGQTVVSSTLQVERRDEQETSLYLDGQELELVSVAVDGVSLSGNEYTLDDESLTLHGLGERHQIEIVTRIVPEQNTALEGLYRSSSMYCTQCEAQGFRRITYYQDRPDVLSRFRTTVVADVQQYPTLLSNGNLMNSEAEDDGRHRATWEDPFPKPSYLFALVAGDLEVISDTFVTTSGRSVDLKIYSEAYNIGQCHYAMDALKRSMAWDEIRFGREYDLDIYMIVAVEDFNMGAMENKGLNIFNTSCVLAAPDTATDAAYLRVEGVIAHEYFHNWSGNRVTCRDWFQLSLKEGFTVYRDAEFSSDMNSRAVKRIEDVTFLRALQFAEDASPLAHPVRPQSYLEISNFYTTTIYEKGAEVVRMYETLLGRTAFRAASDLYFDRFDGSASTTDDFADVMAEVGGRDLSQFKRWYDQAGTPALLVSEQFSNGTLTLTIEQSCEPSPGQEQKAPFHIPLLMGLLSGDSDDAGGPISMTDLAIDGDASYTYRDDGASLLIELTEPRHEIRVSHLEGKPTVSFLREFSAPVKVSYERDDNELAFLARHDVDGFVRWDSLQSLWVKHFAGKDAVVDLDDLVGVVAKQAADLPDNPEAKMLAAMMLRVPEENYLFEQLSDFDVWSVIEARSALLDRFADSHRDTWYELIHNNRSDGAYQPNALGIARRSLSNLALSMAVRGLPEGEVVNLVRSHYESADNLTDRRAALVIATQSAEFDPEVRQVLMDDFFARWHNVPLVLNQWFGLQAQTPLAKLSQLEALETHELFDMKNPNRVRALFSTFGMYNHTVLHNPDGSGYAYLTDAVARIDALNPQTASRLATPLTRWQRYDVGRQELIKTNLQRLLNGDQVISKDLFEIVSKSVA